MLSKKERYTILLAVFLIILGMMALITSAESKERRKDPIVIVNNADPRWDAVIKETVAEFNDAMPKNGPKITYRRGPVTTCETTNICSGPLPFDIWGTATLDDPRHGRIWLQDGTENPPLLKHDMENVVCHEMMHALLGLEDNYDTRPRTSCIYGHLPDLGSWDIKQIRKKFGK
jgi:hypothetical protein